MNKNASQTNSSPFQKLITQHAYCLQPLILHYRQLKRVFKTAVFQNFIECDISFYKTNNKKIFLKITFYFICTFAQSPTEGDMVRRNILRGLEEARKRDIPLWLLFSPPTSMCVSVAAALWLLVRLVLLPPWIIKYVRAVKKMDGWHLWIPAEN